MRPAQTGYNRIKQDQNGPDHLKLGHKPVLTGANQTRPAQTGFDRPEPVLTGANQTRPVQTDFDCLNTVLTG